jgi:hypothetical protein
MIEIATLYFTLSLVFPLPSRERDVRKGNITGDASQ